MNRSPSAPAESPPKAVPFAALRHRAFRGYFLTGLPSMMGDNVEHIISYWVMFQAFHSPALAGFAVISHWAPFLLFGVHFGMLADRFDCRKIIQVSQAASIGLSMSWALLFLTGSLQMWHAVVLLILHGLSGTFRAPATQIIIHDIVGPEHLQSAVRMSDGAVCEPTLWAYQRVHRRVSTTKWLASPCFLSLGVSILLGGGGQGHRAQLVTAHASPLRLIIQQGQAVGHGGSYCAASSTWRPSGLFWPQLSTCALSAGCRPPPAPSAIHSTVRALVLSRELGQLMATPHPTVQTRPPVRGRLP